MIVSGGGGLKSPMGAYRITYATFSNVFVIECTVLENKPLILPQVADIICSQQVILYVDF
jgi:hypothetical protein